MILALLRKWWPEIAAVCLLAFAVWQGYDWIYDQGARDERAMWLNKENRALTQAIAERDKARKAEKDLAKRINDIAERYEQEKRAAADQSKALADDLRAGNRRLRNLWQGCQATGRVSGAAASAAESDAEDRLREASAGRIIGAVRACQVQRNALIDVIEAERK